MTTIFLQKQEQFGGPAPHARPNWEALSPHFDFKYPRRIPVAINTSEGDIYDGEAVSNSALFGYNYLSDKKQIEITGLKRKGKGYNEGIRLHYEDTNSRQGIKEELYSFSTRDLNLTAHEIRIEGALIQRAYERGNTGWDAERIPAHEIDRYPGLVAIITDFGVRDTYVGEVRGAIRRKNPNVIIDDITHQVPPFDIRTGSYLLHKSAKAFPARTVFLGVVDPGVGTAREAIAIETIDGNRYVVPNNGLATHVLNDGGIRAAHRIDNQFFLGDSYRDTDKTFHGRDIFGPAAAVLAYGFPLGWIGPVAERLIRLNIEPPARTEQGIVTGEIEHVDHYGNVVTNIGRELLDGFKFGDTLVVQVGDRNHEVQFVETYALTPKGTWVGVITSDRTFEIARNQSSANETLRLQSGDKVTVRPKVA